MAFLEVCLRGFPTAPQAPNLTLVVLAIISIDPATAAVPPTCGGQFAPGPATAAATPTCGGQCALHLATAAAPPTCGSQP